MESLLLIGGTGHLGYAIVSEVEKNWDKKTKITILTRKKYIPRHFQKFHQLNFEQYEP